jgi:hypothetical protein
VVGSSSTSARHSTRDSPRRVGRAFEFGLALDLDLGLDADLGGDPDLDLGQDADLDLASDPNPIWALTRLRRRLQPGLERRLPLPPRLRHPVPALVRTLISAWPPAPRCPAYGRLLVWGKACPAAVDSSLR